MGVAGLRNELKWLVRTKDIIMRGLSPAHDLLAATSFFAPSTPIFFVVPKIREKLF